MDEGKEMKYGDEKKIEETEQQQNEELKNEKTEKADEEDTTKEADEEEDEVKDGRSKGCRYFNLQSSCLQETGRVFVRPFLSVSEVCRDHKETSQSK